MPQWIGRFHLTGEGSIFRDGEKGIFLEKPAFNYHAGTGCNFNWLSGKNVLGTIPTSDLHLTVYMTQEEFRLALSNAGILG